MAITRAEQARQLYRDAGYVQAAYGKAAATPESVEKPSQNISSIGGDGASRSRIQNETQRELVNQRIKDLVDK